MIRLTSWFCSWILAIGCSGTEVQLFLQLCEYVLSLSRLVRLDWFSRKYEFRNQEMVEDMCSKGSNYRECEIQLNITAHELKETGPETANVREIQKGPVQKSECLL